MLSRPAAEQGKSIRTMGLATGQQARREVRTNKKLARDSTAETDAAVIEGRRTETSSESLESGQSAGEEPLPIEGRTGAGGSAV